MYVSEHARRRGIASLLLAFIEEELRNRGVKSVKVTTGIQNEMAIKTYETNDYIKMQEHLEMNKKLYSHYLEIAEMSLTSDNTVFPLRS